MNNSEIELEVLEEDDITFDAADSDTYPVATCETNNVTINQSGGGGGSSHTHANLSVLDTITSTKVSAWDSKPTETRVTEMITSAIGSLETLADEILEVL